MGIPNILGSLVNNNRGSIPTLGVFPFNNYNTMEKKVKIFPSDYFINEFHLSLNAHAYQLLKKKGKQFEGWHRIRLMNVFVRNCYIQVKTVEIREESTPKGFFEGLSFVKYEVKPNPWRIEYLEYRRNEGFFAIGKRLDLFRTPPLYEMVNY